ncbi:SulP family inorganic anion transporter [Flavicella sediminum]|uniref:SulP family inorganic anion transporter n=1 Tax=Flavicella sediminum TaxID=2585141 RepID=UPI0011221043|nr:sulfate permease [Flavicella sediminum]
MLKNIFPFLVWLPTYKAAYLKKDIIAGITVGVLLIPQGMAYAFIAGLPPEFGLYAALTPQVVYAFLGTSRQLAVGPVAMDSLLVASGLGALAISGIDNYIAMAVFLALFMGTLQMLLGLLKFGFLVNFLSKPIISAFTSAAALLIGLSQLKNLTGIPFSNSGNTFSKLNSIIHHFFEINWNITVLGFLSILSIILINKYLKKIPSGIFMVVSSILFSYLFNFSNLHIALVETVPAGLPNFVIPSFSMENISALFPIALTLALVAFMEATAVSKSLEEKQNEYKIDNNKELVALGFANIIGSFFQSYPTTGGFSRSAVNAQTGAKTTIALLVSAAIIAITLVFLTPLFYYLPKAVLAAIILVAISKLIDLKFPKQLLKSRKDEFSLYIITFFTTLFIGITEGILLGTLLSLILMIYRTSKPHIAVLGNVKGSDYYKNIYRFESDVIEREDLLIIRFDAQLYFGNKDYFNENILRLVKNKKQIKGIIINAEAINYIDSSANFMLLQLIQELQAKSIKVIISGAIGPTRDIIFTEGIAELIGKENLFIRTFEAVCFFDFKCTPSSLQQKITQQSKTTKPS